MTSVERQSSPVSDDRRLRRAVVGSTALAHLVPTALIGWSLNSYLYEHKWVVTASGLLDGKPDRAVLVLGGTGLVLFVVVALVASRIYTRATTRSGSEPRSIVGPILLGALIPMALLALIFATEAIVAPANSNLMPI